MPAVLTEKSALECEHRGAITVTPGQDVLKVGTDRVLVATDLQTALINCPQPPATRCTFVVGIAKGVSTRLKAGGQPVLLAGANGATNAGTWRATEARQTILEAT